MKPTPRYDFPTDTYIISWCPQKAGRNLKGHLLFRGAPDYVCDHTKKPPAPCCHAGCANVLCQVTFAVIYSQQVVVVWITFPLGHTVLPSESLAEMIFLLCFTWSENTRPLPVIATHSACHLCSWEGSLPPTEETHSSDTRTSLLWQLDPLMCQSHPDLKGGAKEVWVLWGRNIRSPSAIAFWGKWESWLPTIWRRQAFRVIRLFRP